MGQMAISKIPMLISPTVKQLDAPNIALAGCDQCPTDRQTLPSEWELTWLSTVAWVHTDLYKSLTLHSSHQSHIGLHTGNTQAKVLQRDSLSNLYHYLFTPVSPNKFSSQQATQNFMKPHCKLALT